MGSSINRGSPERSIGVQEEDCIGADAEDGAAHDGAVGQADFIRPAAASCREAGDEAAGCPGPTP